MFFKSNKSGKTINNLMADQQFGGRRTPDSRFACFDVLKHFLGYDSNDKCLGFEALKASQSQA